ncbi:hypothetical protein DRO22_01840 [Candidatus Bathyarchaeota archaeon]|nr:MAG: hypothetical protein DRO22_01840 [Candidatus Bathyarchaeota archaeon]
MSVEEALREISIIEDLVKPYEYQVYEARKVLDELAALRETLSKMDKKELEDAVKRISNLESQAAPYRGYEPVEEILQHAQRLREELKKLLEA